MTPIEAAWVAGLFEGEGCITWNGSGRNGQAGLCLTSTDYDVIERLHRTVGRGTVVARKPRTERNKPYWLWKVSSQEDFLAVADAIEPHLMSRRTARIQEVRKLLAEWQAVVADRRAAKFRPGVGTCKYGHDKATVGVTTSGYCAECDRTRPKRRK